MEMTTVQLLLEIAHGIVIETRAAYNFHPAMGL